MEESQKTKISIHPEAVKNLVNQSWEFMVKVYWKRQTFSVEEEGFLKNCIAEYFQSIPPEEFSEKSNVYLRNFRWQILRAKQNAYAKGGLKLFAPFIYTVWKKSFSKGITLQNA